MHTKLGNDVGAHELTVGGRFEVSLLAIRLGHVSGLVGEVLSVLLGHGFVGGKEVID